MVSTGPEFYRRGRSLVEMRLLQELSMDPNDSQVRIAKRAGLSLSVAHHYLHRLRSSGLLEFRGPSDKKCIYFVTEAGHRYLEELEAGHFRVLVELIREAEERISLTLERARSDGHRRLGVLGPGALQRLASGIAASIGLELVPPSGIEAAWAGSEAPSAVLVLGDPQEAEPEARRSRMEASGVPCYVAATTSPLHDARHGGQAECDDAADSSLVPWEHEGAGSGVS